MKPSAFICTIFAGSLGCIQATECSSQEIAQAEGIGNNTKVETVCGIDARLTFTGSMSLPLCKEPACVNAVGRIIDDLPNCTISGASFTEIIASSLHDCKLGATTVVADSSQSGWTQCTPAQMLQVSAMRSDPNMVKACGDEQESGMGIASQYAMQGPEICTPVCIAYAKEKFIPFLPECIFNDGPVVKGAVESTIEYCGRSGNGPTTPDGAGELVSAGVSVFIGLVTAAITMA